MCYKTGHPAPGCAAWGANAFGDICSAMPESIQFKPSLKNTAGITSTIFPPHHTLCNDSESEEEEDTDAIAMQITIPDACR